MTPSTALPPRLPGPSPQRRGGLSPHRLLLLLLFLLLFLLPPARPGPAAAARGAGKCATPWASAAPPPGEEGLATPPARHRGLTEGGEGQPLRGHLPTGRAPRSTPQQQPQRPRSVSDNGPERPHRHIRGRGGGRREGGG